ncbi:hypothetical protein [Maricaulis parjimensis]|uniref:hypothetical protein n=1 Tax=Maricaulis parjimensis TaxID=144023 RepID=UPI00193A44AF|nr:hypothetical protein [Maricaulis parjimensis]
MSACKGGSQKDTADIRGSTQPLSTRCGKPTKIESRLHTTERQKTKNPNPLKLMKLIYFTICSKNYLAFALTLRASVLKAHPETSFRIFLADSPLDGIPPCDGIIPAEELSLGDFDDMTFRYTVMEFNTAIKPFCFKHLFDTEGADAAVYLDPDIKVYRPLEHVTSALVNGAAAIVTPHLTEPLKDDGKLPTDFEILRSGTYNLGFAAFSNTDNVRRFLDWWAGKCRTDCLVDLSQGLFVDQKFAEFIPSFVENTVILRHPGYNAAYWNLSHRRISKNGDTFFAGDQKLYFFHFSGVTPDEGRVFSKHQNRIQPDHTPDLKQLLQSYLENLKANGHREWSTVSYAFNFLANGDPIPPEVRRLYIRAKKSGRRALPFQINYQQLQQLAPDVDQDFHAPITVFMLEVWRSRPDIQTAFSLASSASRAAFYDWFVNHGIHEHKVPVKLASPAPGPVRRPLRKRLHTLLARRLRSLKNMLRKVI